MLKSSNRSQERIIPPTTPTKKHQKCCLLHCCTQHKLSNQATSSRNTPLTFPIPRGPRLQGSGQEFREINDARVIRIQLAWVEWLGGLAGDLEAGWLPFESEGELQLRKQQMSYFRTTSNNIKHPLKSKFIPSSFRIIPIFFQRWRSFSPFHGRSPLRTQRIIRCRSSASTPRDLTSGGYHPPSKNLASKAPSKTASLQNLQN